MVVKFVYVTNGALFLKPPGSIIYHEPGRHIFPRYVDDPEASARVGYPAAKPEGEEHGWTRCGLTYYLSVYPSRAHMPMEAIRRDTALLLGRVCRNCRRSARRAGAL